MPRIPHYLRCRSVGFSSHFIWLFNVILSNGTLNCCLCWNKDKQPPRLLLFWFNLCLPPPSPLFLISLPLLQCPHRRRHLQPPRRPPVVFISYLNFILSHPSFLLHRLLCCTFGLLCCAFGLLDLLPLLPACCSLLDGAVPGLLALLLQHPSPLLKALELLLSHWGGFGNLRPSVMDLSCSSYDLLSLFLSLLPR